jgi:hypothetical protein
MRQAYEESELNYHTEDVLSKLREFAEAKTIPLTVEQLDNIPEGELIIFAGNIANEFESVRSKNDPYWDAFWYCIEDAINKTNWNVELPKLCTAA